MTAWKTARLAELVEATKTWNPTEAPSEFFNYVDLSAVDQESKRIIGPQQVLGSEAPSRARQLIARGDILVSTVRPNLNGVAMVPAAFDGATASTGFCVLRPRPSLLNRSFLFHWVKSPHFVRDMVRKATGASYPAVSDRIILESRMPLPSLEEQRRIVDVLDLVDTLRAKRQSSLSLIEALAQSIFIDLFGDPASNAKGWPRKSLRALGNVKTGGTPPTEKEGMFNGPIPFITPGDLETDEPTKRTLTEQGAAESVVVRSGAALVCCIGATIGKIGQAQVNSAFNQQINAIEWSSEVNDSYGFAVMRFFRPTIIAWGASTTLPILKKSAFEKIEIPVPPRVQQDEFDRRLTTLSSLASMHRRSLAVLNELFDGLQDLALRGEL